MAAYDENGKYVLCDIEPLAGMENTIEYGVCSRCGKHGTPYSLCSSQYYDNDMGCYYPIENAERLD